MQDLKAGAPDVSQILHPLREELLVFSSLPIVGLVRWGEFMARICLSLPTCFSVAFLLFAQCEVVIPPVFSFSSLESVPYIAVDCRCVCEKL